jgi:hypothetical protein
MTTRLDLALQKFPGHEESVRTLAARDPSGNLKYLDWGAKMVASGQALAQEVGDVVELFHKFAGQRYAAEGDTSERIHPDIYSYKPKDMAGLRNALLKFQSAQDAKRAERERMYHIDGDVEADVVHEDDDLIVRHVKNKNASVHYGLNTKWCISMLRERHFENYEAENATFFFFERKVAKGDDYDKMALMVPRGGEGGGIHRISVFTAADEHVDIMAIAKVHGTRVFDIFRQVYECSEKYPGSVMYLVSSGAANEEQLRQALAYVTDTETVVHTVEATLESICCHDAAPWPLLEDIFKRAQSFMDAAWTRALQRRDDERRRGAGRTWRNLDRAKKMHACRTARLMNALQGALAIHPNTPVEAREKLVASLRRKHIKVESILFALGERGGERGVHVQFDDSHRWQRRRRYRYRRFGRLTTVKQVLDRADMLKRKAATFRKRVKGMVRKIEEANAKKVARRAKAEAAKEAKRAKAAAKKRTTTKWSRKSARAK